MKQKRTLALLLTGVMTLSALAMTGCGGTEETAEGGAASGEQVIIYSNADDEAVEAMKATLDANGYANQYMFQTFGTSELGGKLMAEGTAIEADLVTMSSFYLDSAQSTNEMFAELDFSTPTLEPMPSYYRPLTSQEGAIFINTEEMDRLGLPVPTSIKDLADPVRSKKYAPEKSPSVSVCAIRLWQIKKTECRSWRSIRSKGIMR